MKISKAKTEKKISQQKAKIKFTLLEMNLLFMISSDIKKRLVKILSADVFKVIIKPKRRGYFPFRMLLNEINVNICQHESRDKKKNGRDQNESLMPQVARAEEVMPVKTPGDPKIYKQQCIWTAI